jgi:hypothetical protein
LVRVRAFRKIAEIKLHLERISQPQRIIKEHRDYVGLGSAHRYLFPGSILRASDTRCLNRKDSVGIKFNAEKIGMSA